jgi:hypothetical protein
MHPVKPLLSPHRSARFLICLRKHAMGAVCPSTPDFAAGQQRHRYFGSRHHYV